MKIFMLSIVCIVASCGVDDPADLLAGSAQAGIQQPPPSCITASATSTTRVFSTRHISLISGLTHGGIVFNGIWTPFADNDQFEMPLDASDGEHLDSVAIKASLGGAGVGLSFDVFRRDMVYSTPLVLVGHADDSTSGESATVVPMSVDVMPNEGAYFMQMTFHRPSGVISGQSGVGEVDITTSRLATSTPPPC